MNDGPYLTGQHQTKIGIWKTFLLALQIVKINQTPTACYNNTIIFLIKNIK